MKYQCTLITVRDMERSKQFYCGLLGLEVTCDFGANVTLGGCIALQTLDTWKDFINRGEAEIILGHNAAELYFEEDDIDGFFEKLAAMPDVKYVHPPMEHSWGQRGVRFYDPDHHIIEVGETIDRVVRRFAESGLSAEQIAVRMDVAMEYVRSFLA